MIKLIQVGELRAMHATLVLSLDREAASALEIEVLRSTRQRETALHAQVARTAAQQVRALASAQAREEAAAAQMRIAVLYTQVG